MAVPSELIEPIKRQLELAYEYLNEDEIETSKEINKQIDVKERKLKDIIKNALSNNMDDVEREVYNEMKNDLVKDIEILKLEQDQKRELSYLKDVIDEAFENSSQLGSLWENWNVQEKKRLQNVVFPMGVELNSENRHYLTNGVNSVLRVSKEYEQKNEGKKKTQKLK